MYLHVTSALAFFFDLYRLILLNGNVKCEYHQLLLQNLLLTFDANSGVTCEQDLRIIFQWDFSGSY